MYRHTQTYVRLCSYSCSIGMAISVNCLYFINVQIFTKVMALSILCHTPNKVCGWRRQPPDVEGSCESNE
jgi:hypothetical protein